ncbi:hypothetical protein RJT34_01146 [Clitoria ternatea]|uniref:Uncharacterized protein n=1 Tax=Clitoria ternatea TaxID=43366 RepID=A0AAN9KJ47_CLITE
MVIVWLGLEIGNVIGTRKQLAFGVSVREVVVWWHILRVPCVHNGPLLTSIRDLNAKLQMHADAALFKSQIYSHFHTFIVFFLYN